MRTFGGIFDGHSGSCAALKAAKQMPGMFASYLPHLRRKRLKFEEHVAEAFRNAFLQVSNDIELESDSGACAFCFFIQGKRLYYASVGDCNMVHVYGESSESLAPTHRFTSCDERMRVCGVGGHVEKERVWTNDHGLQVSRSLGDRGFKKIGVIAEPHTASRLLFPGSVLVVGSDGLFDALGSKIIENCARKFGKEPQLLAKELAKRVKKSRKSSDNFTIITLYIDETHPENK